VRAHDTAEPLLAVAGMRGIVKLVNCARQTVERALLGHGNAINDLKPHPVDGSLLLSASKDESVRLWNLRAGVCVAIFAGDRGHRDEVLSIDVHLSGASSRLPPLSRRARARGAGVKKS